MAIDPRRLRPSELCRLVNSTPLGTVLDERQLHRHRTRAGFRIGDGRYWLWELASLDFPEATPILDWYRLSEHVHAAAEVVFGEGTVEARQWAEERLGELWERNHRSAREAVAALRRERRGAQREALRKLGVYLKNNAERMDYPRYRREGPPLGDGPVESMCKMVLGGRCKQAGMRNWTCRGAEALLRFRAAQFDGDCGPLCSDFSGPIH